MEELKNFNLDNLYQKLFLSDDDFIKWLQKLRLLHSSRQCECGNYMTLQKPEVGRKYGKWQCPKRSCRKKGFLVGTWFENSILSLKEHVKMSYFRCRGLCKQDDYEFEFRREDGSTLGRATMLNGKIVFEKCALAGSLLIQKNSVVMERSLKWTKPFLAVASTMSEDWWINNDLRIQIIQKYVLPGTAVMTDGWAGYNGVVDLPEGYEHYVVNHSENFVSPDDPDIHTQSIESMHQKFKH
uniref:ISXO2-like transposase domain-containing protein n=1 Tax=Ditylenchus dipsaci TaxID=166011 RepID=A0A915EAB8_9BILA